MTRAAAAAALLALPTAAAAHSFGRLYNLPVPLWLYLYGAAAALALSFLVMAWFGTQDQGVRSSSSARSGWAPPPRLLRGLRVTAQAMGLGLLALAIFSGFAGSQNAYLNFNMSGFWIGFVLGFAYLVALCGPLYEVLNPWWLIVRGIERLTGEWHGVMKRPERLGLWPAFVLYLAFIWVELFGGTTPRSLSWLLVTYTLINLAGAWWLGTKAWFMQGEFFAVFLRWLALCAPLHWQAGRLHAQWPFAGLMRAPVPPWSALPFLLFMLSSTAFDGLRETVPWVRLFWQQLVPAVWLPLLGGDMVQAYPMLKTIYLFWQSAALALCQNK